MMCRFWCWFWGHQFCWRESVTVGPITRSRWVSSDECSRCGSVRIGGRLVE
jgi:hypothetical protein